ncbi:MAG: adenylate kinase [Rikenellaceae bacterium]|nr:adenylate kinase [Rikenellaceae bacterium]
MLNVVLFGAPGCGKGTQSELLEKKFGLSHISTGEIIRSHIKAQTPLGQQMAEYISRGELAPDSVVIGMVEEYLNQNKGIKGTIFDGFPRTTAQAEAFDKLLERLGDSVDIMIYMDVPEEELVRRILLRGKDSGRADDASEDVIRNRIEVYNQQTAIVADYYRAQGKYVAVPSLGTIDEVFNRIAAEIEKLA